MSPEEFQQWREGALALGMSKVNDSGALDANYRLFL
jgi:hypothetical protein